MMVSWSGGGGRWGIVVHGGAGRIVLHSGSEREQGCRKAAGDAAKLLQGGGQALDAVQRAVEILESDPQFNAGVGASLTAAGTLELDASIMEGTGLRAGAVCSLPPYLHPILVARAVLEEGTHVFYAANGADEFARSAGFERAEAESMITREARRNLQEAFDDGKARPWTGGTVGAVARDAQGRMAAATSTGGITGKRPGRVGDSPLIGAGTYADDAAGAASATGEGEGIIRVHLCGSAVARLHAGESPQAAAESILQQMYDRTGAVGGLILVARGGHMALARTTPAMSWAAVWDGGEIQSGYR